MTINFYNNFNNCDIHFSIGLINFVKKHVQTISVIFYIKTVKSYGY